ncbi:MAG: LacI family DNA-binding transcriptional regulator [Spirochaetaceae bacterium]|nr:LacI family DNA-binding transcriptional regulator [Spirochaetaceae bacterium]
MTIKDIARESGFAVGTVSRVMNNHPDVAEETRRKVMEVVKKYGFVLNVNAKRLKMQERKTIVIIVKGTSSILLNSLLERVLKKIESSPYNASVIFVDEYDNEAAKAKTIYYEEKPIGFIFLGGSPDWFKEDFGVIAVPSVIISSQADNIESENLSSVSTDDVASSRAMAQMLIKRGHTKIGVIGGDLRTSEMTRKRYRGFLQAMEEAGLAFDEGRGYIAAKYSMEGGFLAAEKILRYNEGVTAIFTMADVVALGAIRKLADMGLRVPDDVSVTGYDGLITSEYFCPRLATVQQPLDCLVEKGFALLTACIEKTGKAEHILVPCSITAGESIRDRL